MPKAEPATKSGSREKSEEAPTKRPLRGRSNNAALLGLNYFARRVGAEAATLLQVGTPFDYEKQMKLYVVRHMPEPREPGYRDALVRWIEHFVTMTRGKAFVLFTNFKLMLEIARQMESFFESLQIDCFVQGTGTPRSLMLEKFKDDINSVLFGTDSFWQGVDVPGKLSPTSLSPDCLSRFPIIRLSKLGSKPSKPAAVTLSVNFPCPKPSSNSARESVASSALARTLELS